MNAWTVAGKGQALVYSRSLLTPHSLPHTEPMTGLIPLQVNNNKRSRTKRILSLETFGKMAIITILSPITLNK